MATSLERKELEQLIKSATERRNNVPLSAIATPAKVVKAEIVFEGEQITIPQYMSIDEAIDAMETKKAFLQEKVRLHQDFNAFPWDGAIAMKAVLAKKFGHVSIKAEVNPFGEGAVTPSEYSIDVGPNGQTATVPWGQFVVPGIKAIFNTGTTTKNGILSFQLSATARRVEEPTIREVFEDIKQELRVNSIYRGKAIKLRLTDETGEALEVPEPKFIDLSKVDPSRLVLPEALERSLEANLFTPIRRHADLTRNGIPVKRGVLLGGMYGTGKTMAATIAARHATDANALYIYVANASEIARAIDFAKHYAEPLVVIFCEDIDRVMSGRRTVQIDEILNIIDGIDTKGMNVITVLTTNNLDTITPAMLRPGRLDAVIEFTPPDAEAAVRLVKLYGGFALDPFEDFSPVGEDLAGMIPATIEEVVKRAKLFQLASIPSGSIVTGITPAAIRESARSMKAQVDLLARLSSAKVERAPNLEEALVKTFVDRFDFEDYKPARATH